MKLICCLNSLNYYLNYNQTKKVVQEKIPKKINRILINDELDLIPLSGKLYQSPFDFSSKSLIEMKYNSNQSNNVITANPNVNSTVLKTIDLNANIKKQLSKEKAQTIEEFYRFSTELDIKTIKDFGTCLFFLLFLFLFGLFYQFKLKRIEKF